MSELVDKPIINSPRLCNYTVIKYISTITITITTVVAHLLCVLLEYTLLYL